MLLYSSSSGLGLTSARIAVPSGAAIATRAPFAGYAVVRHKGEPQTVHKEAQALVLVANEQCHRAEGEGKGRADQGEELA